MKKLFMLLLLTCVAGVSVRHAAADTPPVIPRMNGIVVSSASETVKNGLWSLPTTPGGEWTMNIEMNPGYASFYGGVMYDNVYYATRCNAQYGTVVYVDAYSMEDGTKLWTNYPKDSALPYDLTYNAFDNKIYGFFYNGKNKGMAFGTIKYDKAGEDVTIIKEMEGNWVALAADPAGQLYAISSDVDVDGTNITVNSSSLYKIDRLTGETTLIGETGQLPLLIGSATIDPRSGRMFWTVGPDAESSYLCEVNLATGAATKLMDFEDCRQVAGLYVLTPPAEDDAPAEVTGAVAAFDGGSLSGAVNFTAPTTLYDGTPATGELTYSVQHEGVELASGTTEFGAEVSAAVTVTERGNYQFTVSVANDKGSSPKVKIDRFVGFGVPDAPEGVKAEKLSDSKISVSWNPVTTSTDGGFIDNASVTYTVKRMPGDIVVAENTAATAVEDSPEAAGGMTSYSYVVSADNHSLVSAATQSNTVVCGTAALPWQENFENGKSFDYFTVIDANGDGKTWEYASGVALIKYGKVDMDDWLISPPVSLEAGKVYYTTFKAHSSKAQYPEKVEAKWGAGNTVADMTNTLVKATELPDDYTTLGGFIKPETSGVYHLGIHGVSEADMYNLEVCEVKIEAGINAGAPQAPGNLSVTADADGEYKATITLTAPTTDLSGNALAAIDRIELMRGDVMIHTFDGPAPGEQLTFNDVLEEAGYYVYSAVAVKGSDAGSLATTTAFVGTPVAAAPAAVGISETAPGEVSLSWEKVALSADGNPINPDKVVYKVYDEDGSNAVIAENVTEIPFTFKAVEDGEQQFVHYAVSAVTDRGEGAKTATRCIPVGTPYTDFHESYAGGKASTIYITERINYGNWAIQTDNEDIASQDGDGGYMVMKGYFADYCGAMTTGKISLEEKTAPALRFYSYTPDDSGLDANKLAISVSADGGEWEEVFDKTVTEMGAEKGWHEVIVPLNAYAGKNISLRFLATTVERSYTATYIDNLKIDDIAGVELEVNGISAPSHVRTGERFAVEVSLKNNGSTIARDVTVSLYAGDELCNTATVEAIEPGSGSVARFDIEMSALADSPVEYKAVASHPDDDITDNNTSETVTVTPVVSSLPAPENLMAVKTDAAVSLSWDAPAIAPATEVNDNFESTAAWTHGADGWIMRDMDKSAVCGFGNAEIPGIEAGKTLASFFMFSATGAFENNPTLAAHSGKQYLAALARYDQGSTDDWAISPELDGSAQTVSFYARSYSDNEPERIQVLYSTGSLEPSDFVATGFNIDALSTEWTRCEAALPEGARYFAIRSYATNSFFLMVDDVTYIPLSADNLELTGYNVYRNNKRINEEPVTATAYTDNDGSDGDKWVVTAVYGQRESKGSNVATAVTSAIDSATTGNGSITAAGGSIKITGCEGKPISVSSIDGKTVYNGMGKAVVYIPVANGVYIVKVGTTVRKIAVRSID